jgi:hypothetical protein
LDNIEQWLTRVVCTELADRHRRGHRGARKAERQRRHDTHESRRHDTNTRTDHPQSHPGFLRLDRPSEPRQRITGPLNDPDRLWPSAPPSEVADEWADQRANGLLLDAAALAAIDTDETSG